MQILVLIHLHHYIIMKGIISIYLYRKYAHIIAKENADKMAANEHQIILNNMKKRIKEYNSGKEMLKNPVYSYIVDPVMKKRKDTHKCVFSTMGDYEKRRKELFGKVFQTKKRPSSAPPKKTIRRVEDLSYQPKYLDREELEDMLKEEILSIIIKRNLYKAEDLRRFFSEAIKIFSKSTLFTPDIVYKVIDELKEQFNIY